MRFSPQQERAVRRCCTTIPIIVTNKAAHSEARKALEQAKCERDRDEVLVGRAVEADAKEGDALAKLARYETSPQRSLFGAVDELRQVQNERRNRPSSPILDVVALNAEGGGPLTKRISLAAPGCCSRVVGRIEIERKRTARLRAPKAVLASGPCRSDRPHEGGADNADYRRGDGLGAHSLQPFSVDDRF